MFPAFIVHNWIKDKLRGMGVEDKNRLGELTLAFFARQEGRVFEGELRKDDVDIVTAFFVDHGDLLKDWMAAFVNLPTSDPDPPASPTQWPSEISERLSSILMPARGRATTMPGQTTTSDGLAPKQCPIQ